MVKYILILLLCVNFIYADKINLTKEEKSYLKAHPVIKAHNEKNWPPFNFNVDGKPQGFSIDYMNLLASKVGVKVEYISGYVWKEFMQMLQTPKLDLMINIAKSKQRAKTISFSEPFNTIQNVIYVNINNKNFYTLKDLINKKVALIDGFFNQQYIKKHYQKIKQVLVENQLEALKLLSLGKVDAVIAEKAVADYIITQNMISNIIATQYIPDKELTVDIRLGSSKKDKILIDILNKAQKSLSIDEKNLIQNRWFGVQTLSKNRQNIKAQLTKDEKIYLKNKKILTICVKKDWLPYESYENGKFVGLSADFLRLYLKKLNMPYKIILAENQVESMKLLMDKRCDIKPIIGIDAQKTIPYKATKEYFKDTISLVTRIEQPFVYDLHSLHDKKIAIPKGFKRFFNYIKKEYPNIELIKVKDIDTALKKVASQEIFGYMSTSLTASYKIQKDYFAKLKIANDFKDFKLGIGVVESEPKLLNILNKTMDTTTLQEKQKIINRWVVPTIQKKIDYTYLWYFIAIVLFIVLLFFYRQRILNKYNKALEIKADEALAASKAKSEFLANMSHEIRTPLNAIMGFIDILKEKEADREKLEYLETIDSSSENLLNIINDILDFSKIESGKLQIDKIDFDTKAEFKVITHLFQAKCSQKNISLSLNIDKNLPSVIKSDPLRIKQVVSNLISNAIKFTNEGKNIVVDIKYDDNKLFISVKDKGIGIPKDKLSHIFEAFSQEDNSTTRKYGGTGLGLTISSQLVKLLGGELKVKSEVGKGSEFYFSIPVTVGKELKTENSDTQKFDFTNKKILLVEDDKANQMFMKVLLKKMKLTFDIANDGVEAVKLHKQNNDKYDAILMDENMPNMNGIEATKQILSYEKENNLTHTPVIALTANAIKGDRERFLKAGMDEYLTKPVNKKKLSEVLGKFLTK